MSAPSKAPEINERIGDGRFELLAKLGEGGMSVVYRAHDHQLESEVALKLLQPRDVGRPEREQRLINEGRYLRRLQGQPRIVSFIDDGRLNEFGWPWLATEVLEGKTLNRQFIAGEVSPDGVLRIAYQVAESLLACHRQGIVNRDPTPTNVFVVNEDPLEIKLFDFSHAAELGGPPLQAGMPGRLTGIFDAPGTVGYMSPEQGRKAVPDASMDVFGVGALLYELATGQRPYGQFSSRELFLEAQRTEQLEPLRVQAWTYGLPEDIGSLVYECTQRDPTARPTMELIVKRLEKLGGGVLESEEATERAPKLGELDGDVTAQFDAAAIVKLRSHEDKGDSIAEDERHARGHQAQEPTEQMDVAAVTAPAQPAVPSAEAIGSWTRPPVATPLVNPSQPAAAIVPALDEPNPAPVSPLVSEPVPAPVLEDRTDMLAFARPPQLRESAMAGADWADASEVRQGDRAASEGIDPENPSTDSDAPLGPSRGRIVGVVLGLGVVVMIFSWVAYSKFSGTEGDPVKKIDGERDQPVVGLHDPNEAAESGGALSKAGADIVDSDAEVETRGVEIVPEVEPVDIEPQPKPKSGNESKNGKPKKGTDKPGPSEPSDHVASPECDDVEQRARAAAESLDWKRIVELTGQRGCWSSSKQRTLLRVRALSELGRWKGCLKAAEGSNDPRVQDYAEQCRAFSK